MKTGSESIEATLHRRPILFAEFVAWIDNTRLRKRDVRRIGGGAGCVGGAGKRVDGVFPEQTQMGCFLNELRAFGINADQWTTAA